MHIKQGMKEKTRNNSNTLKEEKKTRWSKAKSQAVRYISTTWAWSMERARDIEREKNAEKELKTVCSKEIKPPATINFFFLFWLYVFVVVVSLTACVSCRP